MKPIEKLENELAAYGVVTRRYTKTVSDMSAQSYREPNDRCYFLDLMNISPDASDYRERVDVCIEIAQKYFPMAYSAIGEQANTSIGFGWYSIK